LVIIFISLISLKGISLGTNDDNRNSVIHVKYTSMKWKFNLQFFFFLFTIRIIIFLTLFFNCFPPHSFSFKLAIFIKFGLFIRSYGLLQFISEFILFLQRHIFQNQCKLSSDYIHPLRKQFDRFINLFHIYTNSNSCILNISFLDT